MRELKFRAWKMHNGKLRRYVCSPFGLSNYAQRHPEAPVLHHQDVNDIRDFMPDVDVIEQYTGLKDKNGKEIYEGDIVEVIGIDIAQVIDFPSGEWRLYYKLPKNKPSGLWEANTTSYIEVIGNIHENPELIKEKE